MTGNHGNNADRSSFRMRIGVVMLLVWFLPFWMLGPYIASVLEIGDAERAAAVATGVIMAVQTLIGVVGAYVAGKETAALIRTTPRRKLAGTVWQLLRHGSRESAASD